MSGPKNEKPYIRSDGLPNASTGLTPSHPANQRPKLPPNAPILDDSEWNSAELLKRRFGREVSFNPNDPNSIFWDTGRKLTAEKKFQLLEQLVQHGRMGLACHKVGVVRATVESARRKDALFDKMCVGAVEIYHETAAAVITHQAIHGVPEIKWNKDGQVISYRVVLETKLREKVLDRADSSYRDTTRQEITVQPAVVALPTPADDVGNWDRVVKSLESPQDGVSAASRQLSAGTLEAPQDGAGEPQDDDSESFAALVKGGPNASEGSADSLPSNDDF